MVSSTTILPDMTAHRGTSDKATAMTAPASYAPQVEWALYYAALGFPVTACYHIVDDELGRHCSCRKREACKEPGKHPRFAEGLQEHGFRDGTSEPEEIKARWAKWPLANIALSTGTVADCLDVDAKGDGSSTLAAYEAEYGPLPVTPTERSTAGDVHYFFARKAGLGREPGIRQGIDRLGTDGYVIVTPRDHISGKEYRWDEGREPWNVELAEWPESLTAWLNAGKRTGARATLAEGEQAEAQVEYARNPVSYAAAVLAKACKAIVEAPAGDSHYTTMKQARLMGGYVAGGAIDVEEARARLVAAAVERGTSNPERTVEDGLGDGLTAPIKLEAQAKNKTADEKAQDFLLTIQNSINFFRDQNGEVQAEWPGSGASPINRAAVNQKIARLAYEEHKTLVSAETVKLINTTLAAITEDTRHPLGVRVHQPDKAGLYVDLGNGQAVDITPEGWSVVPLPAKSFRRYSRQTALPVPDATGTVADFHALLDLVRASESDRLLLKCWLVTCLFPNISHAILSINGPKGTAKTTTATLLRSMIDPGSDSLMSNPHDLTAYAVSAEKRWVMGFDNLSYMPQWLSDGLCMSSTGGTVSKRQLYTDADEIMLDLRRVVIMTSIPQVGEREDLLDRMLMMPLTEISEQERIMEEEWASRVAALLPKALGGLYSVTAAVLASTSARPDKLPRLADWALIASRAAEAMGYTQADFFTAWQGVTDRQTSEAADASPLVDVLEAMLLTHHGEWSGKASALLAALRTAGETLTINMNGKAWPQTPRMLSVKLSEQTTSLRVHGIEVATRLLDGRTRYTLRMPNVLKANEGRGQPATESRTFKDALAG